MNHRRTTGHEDVPLGPLKHKGPPRPWPFLDRAMVREFELEQPLHLYCIFLPVVIRVVTKAAGCLN